VALAFSIGVDFQFHQIMLDVSRGVVTGAIIQFAAARVALPLLFGNIFCSRACWDGITFDLAYARRRNSRQIPPAGERRHWLAWAYLLFSIAAASSAAYAIPDGTFPMESKRLRFGLENAAIIFFGLAVLPKMGGRSYCRLLCPFLTVSGVFARFALFKITPDDEVECDGCGACSRACPMGIDVHGKTIGGKRLNHPDCLLCEACVAACSKRRLRISPPRSILRVFAKKGTEK
jgi:polyferredoxin